MSQITVSGNASGTGIFTIASPATNTNRTLTLPDQTGTILTTATAGVPVNGPAFSAYLSANQSLSTATNTKINFDIEDFDTNNCFASSRFTPTIAGYYQISYAVSFAVAGGGQANSFLYKNGAAFKYGSSDSLDSAANTSVLSCLVYANGTTDYFEVYGWQNSGSSLAVAGLSITTYFTGVLVRSAT